MGKIIYYFGDDRSKLYINIIDKYECTNNCKFCDKIKLEKVIKNNLFLQNKPGVQETLDLIGKEIKKNQQLKEIIFCGIGEPTVYLNTLLKIIKELKKKYKIPIRLNTNGQAYLINSERNVPKELKDAGLDIISISLNSMTKEDYNKLHNPKNPEESFDSILNFIKHCDEVELETYVSFIEFTEFNKKEALNFIKTLGLSSNQVKFRKYIE